MNQDLFNVILGVACALGGGVVKVIWDEVKSLQNADKELSEKMHEIETLVAGDYARKDYLDSKIDALFRKIDKIMDKLDKKVDR